MSKFVRPAAWLRQLFTQSRTEYVNPSTVSQDVSLVQPYDGSGWGIPDPGQMIKQADSGTGSPISVVVYTVPVNRIARLLGLSIERIVSTDYTRTWFSVTLGGMKVGISSVSPSVDLSLGLQVYCPVLPPGAILSGEAAGGGAGSGIQATALIVECPIGTVFYV